MNGSILPNELLVLIGEQLGEHQDRWNLIFVCRHFYRVLLPLLYRSPKLHRWQEVNSFFHAIACNENLALAVRELDLGDCTSKIKPSKAEREALMTSPKEYMQSFSNSENDGQVLIDGLLDGRADAWVALILPLTSQLRQLSLPWGNQALCMSHILQCAISGERPFKDKHHFQHLQKISFRFCASMNEGDVQFGYGLAFSKLLVPFFQLPSLRGFSANRLIDPSYLVNAENNGPTGFSTITDIDLRESCANDGMHTLIFSCAALKSFKYQHSDLPLESIGYRPDRLYHALSRHKETLEVLWLDHHGTHYSYTAGGLNQTRELWIGSLADFTALQELRIPLHNLLDIQHKSSPTTPLFDCLPPSLESLYIEGCKEHHFSMLVLQLDAVFTNGDIRFPNLQRVQIEGNFLDASFFSGKIDLSTPETPGPTVSSHILLAAKTLQRGCDAAGVDLHIYHHDGPQPQIISRES